MPSPELLADPTMAAVLQAFPRAALLLLNGRMVQPVAAAEPQAEAAGPRPGSRAAAERNARALINEEM